MMPEAVRYLRLLNIITGINRQISFRFFSQQNAKICSWVWLDNLFNRVDISRLEKVGPNRSCAEWLIKNGGSVKFRVQDEWIKDYNELAPDHSELVNDEILEIHAENASINGVGFDHFKGCKHVRKITFISCKLINDTALSKLQYVKGSLNYLEIRSCPTITDKGVLSLTQLSNLESLVLHKLRGVRDATNCEKTLKDALTKTNIDLNL